MSDQSNSQSNSQSSTQGNEASGQQSGKRADGAAEDAEDTRGTARFYEYWNQMEMVSWMGARITESADGHATATFEPSGQHHRGAGLGGRAVTGAVQAYIFDIVTGAAVASLAHGTRPQVTVTLDVTFEHPAYETPLTFDAQVMSGGTQLFFVEGVCHDAKGGVTSRCRAIYRRFKERLAPDAETDPETGTRAGTNSAV